MNRPGYQALKGALGLRRGDVLVVKSLDRLSRNKQEMKQELQWFKQGIRLEVIDLPTTMIQFDAGQEWIQDMVNNILIEVLSSIAQEERNTIRKRQREGIEAARSAGVRFGPPDKGFPEDVFLLIKQKIYQEYLRYEKLLRNRLDKDSFKSKDFYDMIDTLRNPQVPVPLWSNSIQLLTQIAKEVYGIAPLLFIDEYDQPIMSSYEGNFHEQMGNFFSNLYGAAMKGNASLGQELLTGVQRVAKESIFSQFNNARVYTVLYRQYAPYFGITEQEAGMLLQSYGLSLNDAVKNEYDGYTIGGISMYNPWSLINYADFGVLDHY